jgi:hypothetical protein
MIFLLGVFMGMPLFWMQSHAAYAARAGVVSVPETTVYLYPDKRSAQVIKLHQETPVVASNFPTLGFHKVRLRSLLVGWVDATHLTLQSIPPPEPEPNGSDANGGVCLPGTTSPSSEADLNREPQAQASPTSVLPTAAVPAR